MGKCKKDITPLLTHWSYVFLALTHRNGVDYLLVVCHLTSICWDKMDIVSINLLKEPLTQVPWKDPTQRFWITCSSFMMSISRFHSVFCQAVCPVFANINIYINGLVQERRNSSALAMELRLSCTNPSIWPQHFIDVLTTLLFEPEVGGNQKYIIPNLLCTII